MSLSICILLSTVIFVLLISFSKEAWAGSIALVAVLTSAVISSWIAMHAVLGHPYQEILAGGHIMGLIPVRIDALSGWFILLTNFTVLDRNFIWQKVYEVL